MTEHSMTELQQMLASILSKLENTQMLVELSRGEDTAEYREAKARALEQIRLATADVERLAVAIGDVPVPVRH